MSIWGVLKNLGAIISFFKIIRDMISGVAESKKAPPKEQVKALLDQVEALLDSGTIDIPNVDEKAISDALKLIEEQLLG